MSQKTKLKRPPGRGAGGSAVLPGTAPELTWLWGVLLVAITAVAYLPVWHAGFVWNDDTFLLENPLIKSGDGWWRFWARTEAPDYFPMTSGMLWVEWRLWGANSAGYHLINLGLHLAGALGWWRVLARLKVPGAWLAAAIFAVHPVNVESVAWITERKNTLAMFFYVWALWWYFKFEDAGLRRRYWFALGMFALSLLSKPAGVMLPVVVLGAAWWRRGRVERRDVARMVPFFAAALALGLVTMWFQAHRAISTEMVRTDDGWSRLAVAGRAVWFYLFKAVLPVNLAFVYPRWNIGAVSAGSFVPGILLVVGLAVGWVCQRTWGRAALFGGGYFVLLLLPVLGFVDIYYMRYSLVADHWQYFAIMGPIALAAAGMAQAGESFAGREPWVGPAAGGVLLAVLVGLTWQQAGIYHDRETLWRDTLKQNPQCWLAEDGLANALVQEGRLDEARPHYDRALEINPDDADAYYNLGVTLARQQQLDAAISHLEKAIAINPGYVKAYNNLGIALSMAGRSDEAIGRFEKTLELDPQLNATRINLAVALSKQGRVDEAISQVEQYLKLEPADAAARQLLATLVGKKTNQ